MKQNETNLGEKREKREDKYYCIFCDYVCCVKFSYDRHLLTSKHIKQAKMKQNETNETKKEKKEKKEKITANNICECGQVYNSRTTLWRHKQKCSAEPSIKNNKDDLINYLIKENHEFKNLILEIVKKDTYTTNTYTNSHNKAFNLNLFLNETCKDAMNIMDFVDSIKLQLTDLERVGEFGFVDGISNIIIKNLKELDVTVRPIHCTDKKREVLYVKDEDLWQKEDQQNKKVRTAIKKISDKNMKLIPHFQKMHPDCNKSTSKIADKYNTIIYESMGGKGDNIIEKENKIITNISKQVIVEKES
jgi:Txe/YoeB family toxin of Txe-Axe toxin-antitoxin module